MLNTSDPLSSSGETSLIGGDLSVLANDAINQPRADINKQEQLDTNTLELNNIDHQNKTLNPNINNNNTTTTSTAVNTNPEEAEEELNETTRDIIQKIKKLGEEPSSPTEPPYIDFMIDSDCTVAGASLRSKMDIDDFLNANPEYSLLDRLDGGTKVKVMNEKHFEQRQRREERKNQIVSLMKQLEDEERKQEEKKKKDQEEIFALQLQSQQDILKEFGRRTRGISNATKESHLTTSAFNFADNVVESVGNTAANFASGVGNVTRASTNVVGSMASGVASGVGTVASGVSNGVGTVASGVGSVAESVASGVASVGKGFWNMVGFRSRSGSNPHPFIEEVDVDHSPPKNSTNTSATTETERTRGRSSSFLSILPFTGEVIEPYIIPSQKSTNTPKTAGTPTEDYNFLSPKPASPPLQQFHHPKNMHHDMMMHFKTPQVLEANSPIILKEPQLRELSLSFPLRFRNKNLVLLYSTQEHGISLLTLYRKVAEQQPIIVIVETTQGEVFGTFLTSEIELTKKEKYYGDGESFVFKFDKIKEEEEKEEEPEDHDFILVDHPHKENRPQPTIHTYKWMKTNEYFQLSSARQLAVGGGGDGFAFTLDADLKYGSSHASETFGNEPLTSTTDFQIYSVEAYTLESLTAHSSAHLTKHQSLKLIN